MIGTIVTDLTRYHAEALRPASVLIVISDLYFQDDNGDFVAMLRAAQDSYREVILVP